METAREKHCPKPDPKALNKKELKKSFLHEIANEMKNKKQEAQVPEPFN